MKGYLIVNEGLARGAFAEAYDALQGAAAARGVALTRKTNADFSAFYAGAEDLPPHDFILFWDKDIRLAKFLEARGSRLFNRADAIAACDDKGLIHAAMTRAGVKTPKTVVAPLLFSEREQSGFLSEAAALLGFPVVVKECFGSFGAQVYKADNPEELAATVRAVGRKPFILQEFIKTSFGRDVRLYVAGGRVIAAMLRRNASGDFRANLANGGTAERYEPDAAQVKTAVRACAALGLDFGGADILFGAGGEPVLCEVNSNALFAGISKCSGADVAGAIIDCAAAAVKKRGGGRRRRRV